MNRVSESPPRIGPSYYGSDARQFVRMCYLKRVKNALKLAQKARARVKKAQNDFTRNRRLKRKTSISGYQKYFFRLLKEYRQKCIKYLKVKKQL